jgi:hypothetical protein
MHSQGDVAPKLSGSAARGSGCSIIPHADAARKNPKATRARLAGDVKLQLPRNERGLKISSQVARSFGRDYRRRLKLSWLLILSMVMVDYLGFDRLGNPRRCRFDGDAASLEGASR